MKKLLITALLSLLVLVSFSQTTPQLMYGSGDTITDTGTDFVLTTVAGTYENISVQAVVTKLSGTVAGSVKLYGTIDGTNYDLVSASSDTLALTDVTTNTKVWVLNGSNYTAYKMVFTGAGTMSARIKGYIFTANQYGKHAVASMLSNYSKVSDTTVNSGSAYVDLQVKGGYKTVSIQAVVTKISGTVGGTVTLQGSNDGVNFVTVSASYSTAQTLTALNQTTTDKIFVMTGSPYAYYRLSHTGTGTMSSTIKGYLLANK